MITILGPTASGKTSIATLLAFKLGSSEILSADSRQVYQGMDIGTGKDLSDYFIFGKEIPYHLIDIVPAGEKYNLFSYQKDFHLAYQDMMSRGVHYPIMCGGSGMYAEAILKGYNLPDVPINEGLRARLAPLSMEELAQLLSSYGTLHNTTDLDTPQRAIRAIEIADYRRQETQRLGATHTQYPPIPSLIVCLDLPVAIRRERISNRLKSRLEHGMIEEVEQLLNSGIEAEALIYYGLEYKFVTRYVMGEIEYSEMYRSLEIAIHQFAKRQMTWFRGMERRGFDLHYIDALSSKEEQVNQILKLLETHYPSRPLLR